MARLRSLDPAVRDVLGRSTVDATRNLLVLPEQLDRPTYVAVDKALKVIGGKWDRKAGGHVFPFDPSELIDVGVATGQVEDRVQALQFFQTPVALAARMVKLAKVSPGDRVLEPSAGHGRIVLPLMEVSRHVTAVEIDAVNAEVLRDRIGEQLVTSRPARVTMTLVVEDDFLKAELDEYDAIVMNPPFADGQDIAHIRRAHELLAHGGRLVAICSEGPMFRADVRSARFRNWLEEVSAITYTLPDETFQESGTRVRSRLLTIAKPT